MTLRFFSRTCLIFLSFSLLFVACQGGDSAPPKEETPANKIEAAAENAASAITKAAEQTVRGMGEVKTDLDRLITDLEAKVKTITTNMGTAGEEARAGMQEELDKIRAAQNRIAERMSSVSVERKDKATMVEELTEMVREIREELNIPEGQQSDQGQ